MTEKKRITYLLFILSLLFATFLPLPPVNIQAASSAVYDDQLTAGWENRSWDTDINLQATSPVQSGSYSMAVTYTCGWAGVQLYYPGFYTTGYNKLSFYIHGGSSGGQRYKVAVVYPNDQTGPDYEPPQATANTWTKVEIPLSTLGAQDSIITQLRWQDATGSSQPTFYLDNIIFSSNEHPDGPILSAGNILPRAAPVNGTVTLHVDVADPQGIGDIAGVMVHAGALGYSSAAMRDDGKSNDGAAGNDVYGTALTVRSDTSPAEHLLSVSAEDQAGHEETLSPGAFISLSPSGGSIPPVLPQRIGIGTNEWAENPAQDWQVNSGVSWDYVYQYITYDWYLNGWGGNFVGRFVNQAWDKDYIPVISVYMILGVTGGIEDPLHYAQALQNSGVVNNYLAAIQTAAAQANGSNPVIFHLEPDFYGFMQQLSNQIDRRPGYVRQDDPTSYPVALNVSGYPNNLAGLGRRMVDLIHATAPNVLVAPHASMWATNKSPQIVPANEVNNLAQRTVSFINAMGGAQSDLFFVEWSDRDAGSGLREWWDDTDRNLPRPTRAILWENALSVAANKKLMLWQMPCGNMSLDNTPYHYQDNRAAYAFNHLTDLVNTGVIALMFGDGAEEMTRPSTDGNYIRDQAAIAYAPPGIPTGLNEISTTGPTVLLSWQENSEPDLAGYVLSYQPVSGGATGTVHFGRANSRSLLIPEAGDWRIRIAARDAMGNLSAFSSAITVTTTESATKIFLPIITKS